MSSSAEGEINKAARYEEKKEKKTSGRPRGDMQNETDAVIATSPAESLPVISDSYKLPAGVITLRHLRHHTPHGRNLAPGKNATF